MKRISNNALLKAHAPVALGFMDFGSFDSGAPVLDAFWEAGGTMFDTAWVYHDGYTEQLLGEWLTHRDLRSEAIIIGKGAHTPHCNPKAIGKQLTQSLDRMQTDYVDVYLMHRDNPKIPVGEFVDAIDAEIQAGRIRGPYGGSNWTMQRMDEAIRYAKANKRAAPSVLSNNFSLADMVDSVWPGCVGSSTPEWRAWLTKRQIINFAWSSQSRGFFTNRAGPRKLNDAELVRCWYSPGNFSRRSRATELATKLGVKPIHIAFAYVLSQQFPQVALIGPHTVRELRDSMRGFEIALSEKQVAWLRGSP
jgi:aryl-alcohol dehydrogenase-like predicted oxidoreductase